MDKSIDPRVDGSVCEGPRGVDATGLKLAPPAPITDLGRAVKYSCDASDRGLARRSVRQIPADKLGTKRLQKNRVGAGPNEGSNPVPLLDRALNKMAPQ